MHVTTKKGLTIGRDEEKHPHTVGGFLAGIGHAFALAFSWKANHSILWVILHAIFGWYYVAWYVVVVKGWIG